MLNDEIRERIKKLMKEKKLKGYELAEKVNMTPSSLSDLLSGKKKKALDIDDLFNFAKALDVTEYFLLTGIKDENRNIAKTTGLSNNAIEAIKGLNEKKKTLLEMLILDDGSIGLAEFEKGFEPEFGFLDALSNFANHPDGNRIVELIHDPEGTDVQSKQIYRQAPHNLRILFADGTIHEVSEWKPDRMPILRRIEKIRNKYLRNLKSKKYIPTTEEEDDDE